MASMAIFLSLFKSIDATNASHPLLSSCLVYELRALLDIFTLTYDWVVAAAVAGARAVSAGEGEGPILLESIVLVGQPTGSLM